MKEELNKILFEIYKEIDLKVIFYKSLINKGSFDNYTTKESDIENYILKCGFIKNTVKGKTVLTKGFLCIEILDNGKFVQLYHDIENSSKYFIEDSLITSLPIAIKYMSSRGMAD